MSSTTIHIPRSILKAIVNAPKKIRNKLSYSVFQYLMEGEYDADGDVRSYMELIINLLEISNKRRDIAVANGLRGGAPDGNMNARKKQPKNNQESTKGQPRINQVSTNEQPKNNVETTNEQPKNKLEDPSGLNLGCFPVDSQEEGKESTKEKVEEYIKKTFSNENVKESPAGLHTPAPAHSEEYQKFLDWMSFNAPYCHEHMDMPTENELMKLKSRFGGTGVADVISQIENRKDLRKRYKSLYRTILNWAGK